MALEENIITWNVTNWITVVLMAAIAYTIFGFAQSWWSKKQAA